MYLYQIIPWLGSSCSVEPNAAQNAIIPNCYRIS